MKLLTKEQEAAHYNATLKGGILGGTLGMGIGAVGVLAASRRYAFFRQLTLPLKAFLITSGGTFGGIIAADHASREFEREQNPIDREFQERERQKAAQDVAGKTFTQRAMDFGRKERYKIVGVSWIASMIAAFSIVNRNKFLTGQQKLVQARVYAQFLTVGVLVATAAFEISDNRNETGRYETVKVLDPNDPEHKRYIEKQRPAGGSDGDSLWKDMVAAEEERIKEREEDEKQIRGQHSQQHKKHPKKKGGNGETDSKDKKEKDDSKSDGDDKSKGGDDKKGGANDKKQGKDDKEDSKSDKKEDKDDGKDSKKKSADDAKSKK